MKSTHVRIYKESLDKLQLMSEVEGTSQIMILAQIIDKREKDLHDGNVRERARALGLDGSKR